MNYEMDRSTMGTGVYIEAQRIGYIYQTRDYDLFSYHEGNRRISEEHVKGLLKSFNECHYELSLSLQAW